MSAARALLLAPLALLTIGAAPVPPFELDGMRVAVAIDGDPASAQTRLTLTLTDVATGAPVRGAHPLGWLASADPTASGPAVSGAACDKLIGSFVQGGLASRARADFNAMRILSLTDRDDLIALNPTVSLGGTQIEQVLHLGAPPAATAMRGDGTVLAIAVKGAARVLLVDSRSLKTTAEVALDEPATLLAWHGSQLVAATRSGLVVIADSKRVAHISLGLGGAPDLLVAGEHVLLAARGNAVVLADPASGAIVGRAAVKGPLGAGSYSALADAFLLLDATGKLTVLGHDARPRALPPLPSLAAIEPVGTGRNWLAIDRDRHELLLIDGASGALRARTTTSAAMDQVRLGAGYAYVYSGSSDTVDLVELGGIDDGKLDLVTVPMSEKEAGAEFGRGARLAMLPGGAVVASPSGRGLAYYVEGMMAPMGSIPHYGMATRGLFAVNDSLTEQAPGVYSATTRYRRGGAMLLPLLLDRPRAARCLPVTLPPIATKSVPAPRSYVVTIEPQQPRPLAPALLSLAVTGQPSPGEMRLLVTDDVNWQRRLVATRDPAGRYVATVRFPDAGLYHVTADAPALGHHFGDQRFDVVVAQKP